MEKKNCLYIILSRVMRKLGLINTITSVKHHDSTAPMRDIFPHDKLEEKYKNKKKKKNPAWKLFLNFKKLFLQNVGKQILWMFWSSVSTWTFK